MSNNLQSRRSFLRASGAAVGLSLAGVHLSSLLPLGKAAAKARDSGIGMQVLSADEAADIEAITAQIIPTDDTPGAREAGVVYFIDAAMGAQLAHMLAPLRTALAEINALTGEGGSRFSTLEASRQYSVACSLTSRCSACSLCRLMVAIGITQAGNLLALIIATPGFHLSATTTRSRVPTRTKVAANEAP